MRRAITAISFMFFGAAILVFISALLIPLLKESSPSKEKSEIKFFKSETSESSDSSQNANPQMPNAHLQDGSVTNQPQATVSPAQSRGAQYRPPVSAQPDPTASSEPTENAVNLNNQDTRVTGPTQPVEASETQSTPASTIENAADQNPVDSNSTSSQQTASLAANPQAEKIPYESAKLAVTKEPTPTKATATQKPESLLILGDGFFAPGAVTPKANSRNAIERIIPIINSRSQYNVLIEGHADKIISDKLSSIEASKLNKTISLRRAISVAMLLEQKGIASDRIIVSGLGDSAPIASNLTKEGRAKNRRVEIKLSPAQQ